MSRPFLLVVAGLPGSGKSALCAALGQHLPMQILSTDRIRRELFQVRLHTAGESRAVYDELWRRATASLRSGASVAIDATNLTRPQQSTLDWRDLAAQEQAALLGFHLQAGESTLRDRLRAREALDAREDASEATETALPSFVGTGPPSFAVPVDAELFSIEQIAVMSHAWTPYGFKRDRWVNGDVAAVVGCPPELLGPAPPEGTLLSNLTACLDRVLGRPTGEGLPSVQITAPSQVLLLTEEVHAVEGRTVAEPFEPRTYLAKGHDPALPEPTLLIYATRARDVETYVTAFTVSDDYGTSLLAATGPDVTIRPRFNVASPFGEARLDGSATISTWPN
jgi:predicted kinase